MHDTENPSTFPKRAPWNKGKLIGPRPPLRQKHVWAIRTRLQIEQQICDLALFNLAVDSKLRGCDVVAVKVDDVAPNGHAIERATVRQRKTGRPVRFELTEQTRQAINEYLAASGQKRDDYQFGGRRPGQSILPANMRAFCLTGSPESGSIRMFTARIRYGGPRRR